MPSSVKLVLGYLPGVDEISPEAERLGLKARFAFVLPARTENDPFDDTLLCRLLQAVLIALPNDHIATLPRKWEASRSEAWDAVRTWFNVLPHLEHGLSTQAYLKKNGGIVALLELEYAVPEGPAPYYNDYSFAVYAETYDAAMVQRQVLGACFEHGAVLTAVLRGEDQPRHTLGRLQRDLL